MNTFRIPEKSELTQENQHVYDQVEAQLGFVPNLYMYMAKHDNALPDYLTFIKRKSTLTNKEKEVVSLVVSEINCCNYCLSAHTTIGKMNGFTEAETIEIRKGNVSFDSKLNALTELTANLVNTRGKADDNILENFFNAGYSEEQFIDVVFVIADKIISNFIAVNTKTSIDFPLAQSL